MKEKSSIPISKIQRASKFLKTGAKVGGNYIKHYSKKMFDPNLERENLDMENAKDIYESLSELKGSALKVAQMLSMDKHVLPKSYVDVFSKAQYNAPPLSYPLIAKTFKKEFKKSPTEIFESFSRNAVNAASIGQVHKASKDGKTFAVKIQYPGVAASVTADLRIVKPLAMKMLNINPAEINEFMDEVELKLLEETDYELELKRSIEITALCKGLKNIVFPKYYSEMSGRNVITMDWIDATQLKHFLKQQPSQATRNRIGQALWDFYDFQIHKLKKVHADPHPGNFMINDNGKLCIIDFGCVKEIPEDFYLQYFPLMTKNLLDDENELASLFLNLGFITPEDGEFDRAYFTKVFKESIELLGKPFREESFDFGDDDYFQKIYTLGDTISKEKLFRQSKSARGSKHGLYINRTYFGLFNILHDLRANITITNSSSWK